MSGHLQFIGRKAEGMRFAAPALHAVSRRPASAVARPQTGSLRRLLALRGLPADILLIVAYIALSRAFIGDEARLGIKIGPLPLFVTDAILLVLIVMNLHKRGGRLLQWSFGGGGAGQIGRAVWLLFLITVVYFALAFPQYRLLAMRDLAIFGYSIFFPLTYFALTQRVQAAKLVRYFIYATCLGAALFEFQTLSGVKLFNVGEIDLGLAGHGAISRVSAGNLGADLGPALAGLFVYLVADREHRLLHAGAMLLCLTALVQILDRTALLGFAAAGLVMFILGVGRSRVYVAAVGAGLLALLLLSAQGELPIPGGARLHNVWLGLSSGANFQTDPDAQFRLRRWQSTAEVWMTSPVFGVGFGAPIMLDTWGTSTGARVAAERGGLGAFNVGMPHNSFLLALARTGLIGLGLICFAWAKGIMPAMKLSRRRMIDPDRLAIACALIAMIFTAALNLFFERPMLCAPFWIMLAASYKLSEAVPRQSARKLARTSQRHAMIPLAQELRNARLTAPGDPIVGGWQDRWK